MLWHRGFEFVSQFDITMGPKGFTRSPGKEADAHRLGADRVVRSTDASQMAAVAGHFDLIIDTVPYVHDTNPHIPTLAYKGSLVLVGYLGSLAASPSPVR